MSPVHFTFLSTSRCFCWFAGGKGFESFLHDWLRSFYLLGEHVSLLTCTFSSSILSGRVQHCCIIFFHCGVARKVVV